MLFEYYCLTLVALAVVFGIIWLSNQEDKCNKDCNQGKACDCGKQEKT